MKGVSCVTQLSFVEPVTNVQTVVSHLPVGARLQNFWKPWLDLGASPKVVYILREDYTLPFQIRPSNFDKVTHHHKLLCLLSQDPLPVRGIASAYGQKRSRTGPKPKISGIFQMTFLDTKAQKQVETYTRSEQSEPIPQSAKIQNGGTGNHQNLPPTKTSRMPTSIYQYRNNPGNI